MSNISAILPLKIRGRHYADNIGRCDILFSSLRHFSSPKMFARFVLVVPHDELDDVKKYAKAWSDFPIEIVDESLHFSIFSEFSRRHQIRNWHRQQIIKLYAPALIETEYFIVFDPDCFATHKFNIDTIIIDGKALTHYQPRTAEPSFWRASAELLQLDPHLERNGLWWTPAILSRTLCLNLHGRLEELYQTDWRRVLLSHYTIDWTEYTLYWLNAEREGLLDQYHTSARSGEKTLHATESVWFKDSMKDWNAAHHFAMESDGLFAVVQSNTYISPQTVAEKLSPYFPISLQPYQRHAALGLRTAELYSAIVRRGLKGLRRMCGR
ncbi:DUF6492 family protein [Gluconacetobacter asukensis]|uniref:Uncharacterized protein n=1 Tax=Gluconacetobacter asukensis TaxID=1017181 RepID=A0A7W4P069_9PROT|nr:DUF6492 family protein [Gluconacetobacter asukensis]MBB2172632.1 hypothetical protein [Gluconacetobacter asukensis]